MTRLKNTVSRNCTSNSVLSLASSLRCIREYLTRLGKNKGRTKSVFFP